MTDTDIKPGDHVTVWFNREELRGIVTKINDGLVYFRNAYTRIDHVAPVETIIDHKKRGLTQIILNPIPSYFKWETNKDD